MPENFPLVDGPVTVRNKHPWSFEEKFIITFMLGIPAILCIVHLITGKLDLLVLIAVTATALVGTAGLYYLGWSRKKTSELIATLDATHLKVIGNKLPDTNHLDLLTVETIRSEKVGINPTFFLSTEDKKQTLRVPFRIAKQSPVREALLSIFDSAKLDKSAQALALELEK